MHWRWDDNKAKVNKAKHGVSFETATLVFDDPLHLSYLNDHPDGDRWETFGRVGSSTLVVIHTFDDDQSEGRIISVRRATAHERRAYEQER